MIWGIIIGIVATHVAYAVVFVVVWYRVIWREKQEPNPRTDVERIIVRDIGTLTYSRRN